MTRQYNSNLMMPTHTTTGELRRAALGQHFAAISDYDKAIQLKPDDANAYYNRGVVKGKLGQYFAAISDFDKAIQLKPDYTKAYHNRGVTKGSPRSTLCGYQ